MAPHVPDYPAGKLELVAAVRVRDALGIQPGDRVVVEVATEPAILAPTPLPGAEGLSVPDGGAHSSFSRGEGTFDSSSPVGEKQGSRDSTARDESVP